VWGVSHEPRVAILYPRSGDPADAIDQYCAELGTAFSDLGWSVQRSERLDAAAADADLLAVQYNPFGYGRWGFAPSLPAALTRLRHRRLRPIVAVVVHERYVPIADGRSLAMGIWQRGQLRAVRAGADAVFYPVEFYAVEARRSWPSRPTEHLTVGSTLPDRRAGRQRFRADRGWADETIVVATLGSTSHPSMAGDWIAPTLECVAGLGRPTLHADLGADPSKVRVPRVDRLAPGYLDADTLAAHLAAADLLLAPFADGISGRRTTVMAALRNEVAVVSTFNERSDRILASPSSGLTLVRTGDQQGFASAARELAADDALRRKQARLGAALYRTRFDWPIIAASLARANRGRTPSHESTSRSS